MRSGRATARYRGVYCLGPEPLDPLLQTWGALLACGDGSALHAETALAALGVLTRWVMPFRILTPHNRSPAGIRVHRARWLEAGDIIRVRGMPVEQPALALLYGAGQLPGDRLVGAINTLRRHHGLSLERLDAMTDRFPRHRNTPRIREILSTGAARDITFSQKEALWRPFALAYRLPDYTMNTPVPGTRRRADVLVHDPPCIVEIDGGLHDITTRQDHARDIEILAATGLPTLRVDPEDIQRHPARTARRLHAALEAISRSRSSGRSGSGPARRSRRRP